MTAHAAQGRRGVVAAALARAEAWLLEPAAVERADTGSEARAEPWPRPVVAVVGLAPRCGTTTLARALAAELGRRDPARAAAVASVAGRGGPALGTPAAARLARALTLCAPGRARALGRVCLVDCREHGPLAAATRPFAPLVLDVAYGAPPTTAVSIADHVLLVAAPAVEPALAAVAAASLACGGPEPVTVLNRAGDAGRWQGRAAVLAPESRLGAQLAAGGREPRGALGAAISELADRCERPA